MTPLTPRAAVIKLWSGCLFVIVAWLLVSWTVVHFSPW